MAIAASKTVGEIAAENPETTREFEKLGIDYCCGGSRSLAEACAQASISVDEVLNRLEKSMAAREQIGAEDWFKRPLSDLISHINGTHHVFVREECPRIEALVAKVVSVHGKNHPELQEVQEVFSGLSQELALHMMKEEQILFPYVIRLEENFVAGEPAPPAMFGSVLNPVRMMMHEHDAAGDALRSLRSLTAYYRARGRLHQLPHSVSGLAGL